MNLDQSCILLIKQQQVILNTGLSGSYLLSSVSFLSEHYLVKGLSVAQIARIVSSARSTVLSSLKYYNIPIREPSKPHGRKSQLKFGEKIVNGKIIAYKREENVIETIKKLRDEGLSLRKIADLLTAMKVPSKVKGMKWNHKLVESILKREDPN